MKTPARILAAITSVLLFSGTPAHVDAKEPKQTTLADCVTLSDQHQGARSGTQYLLLKDGDAHYRVGFGGSCDALARSSVLQVSTGKVPNQLCASGTKVKSRTAHCIVRSVETIDADEYESYARRGRR